MVMEREGYTVLFAENSAEALNILKDTIPDLILLDVVLGGDSGFDLFQTIKKNPETENVPILFGSGRSHSSAIIEGFRMGANDYITKPYSPHEICARIELQITLKEQEKLLKSRNHELTQAYKKLEKAQAVAIRSEKLAAIGSLSTGIAHEMSTPLSFIISNLKMLGEYIGDIYQVLWAFQDVTSECVNESGDENLVKLAKSAMALREDLALDVVMDELTELARENLEGAESIARIAKDLCEFSRDDIEDFCPSDINMLLEKALTLSKNELSGLITIDKSYADIPEIECVQSRLTQLFLIIIMNAVQAMDGKGRVQIRTRTDEGDIVIEIEDEGCGIAEADLKRIFEPFFTTKTAGQGTGLGLSIAHGIVSTHGGTVHVNSTVGQGATFIIKLPIKQG